MSPFKNAQKNFCLVALLFVGTLSAAQPVWVVRTLTNIRRAVQTAQKAKNASRAIAAIGKCQHALPESEITKLAQIASKPGELKEVGKILGKMNLVGKYGDDAGHLVLQDTYLRIALKNGCIPQKLAVEAIKGLGGTPGLTALLRKINSASPSQAKGHLRELEIALGVQKRGFMPVSCGYPAFGVKRIDLCKSTGWHGNLSFF